MIKPPDVLLSIRHVEIASPILKLSLILVAALAGLCIGAGALAIVWNAHSPTSFSFFGMDLTTGHVGVALIALGMIVAAFVFTRVFKYLHRLAALPPDHSNWEAPRTKTAKRR